jgi:hypothetical protein
MILRRIFSCVLFVFLACHPHKKTSQASTLPGLRATQEELCQLFYSVSFDGNEAQVTAYLNKEDKKTYTAKGFAAGSSFVFEGVDLFEAPRSCSDSEIKIEATASPRFQISTSLVTEDKNFLANSVKEAKESFWVVGRETELRMLQGAFTAVFIGDAQDKQADVSSLVSLAEALFGQPSARQLLLIGPSLSAKKSGLHEALNSQSPNFEEQLSRSIASLWLSSSGAISYYGLFLRAHLGSLPLTDFIEELSKDAPAARFFCFDVLARSKGASLSQALQTILAAHQETSERNVSANLQISACLGDGLGVAAPSSGVLTKRGSATVVDAVQLQKALGW